MEIFVKTANGKRAQKNKFSSVGKSAPRVEGILKVSGQALYTADNLPPGTLWGKVLRSPHPHARIIRVNASQAKVHPGVEAALTAADIPAVLTGRRLRDMPMLARDRARLEKLAGEIPGTFPFPVDVADLDGLRGALGRVKAELDAPTVLLHNAVAGGFGTFEEFCEVVTWTQLGVHRKSCGLLNVDGFYDPLITQFDRGVDEGFIKMGNRRIVVADADPAALLDALARLPAPPEAPWISGPEET